MYLLTKSTPDCWHTAITDRTHKSIETKWAKTSEGSSLWYNNVVSDRYIGCFINGKLVKPMKA